jgi:ribosomal protein S18 acetylase RimI-like enzyme
MITRLATMADMDVVLALAARAHAEGRYGRYPMSHAKASYLFMRAQTEQEFFCVVAEQQNELVGFMVGLVCEHFFSNMTYATNIALYVTPEQRGSWAAAKLIRTFEREADARGAHEILIGAASDIKPARVLRFYHALGYQPVGANAVKYLGD